MKHTFTIRTPEVKKTAMDFISMMPIEPLHEVIVREHKKDRSAAQNSLYWYWLTMIGGEWGLTKDEVHKHYKAQLLVRIYERDDPEYGAMIESVRKVSQSGMKDDAQHLMNMIVDLTSTTKATVKQFTEFLNDIEKDAMGKGIVLPHPEDRYYEAMGIERGKYGSQ